MHSAQAELYARSGKSGAKLLAGISLALMEIYSL